MKKMKKALALSLALVMSATLFGCAPKENPAANSPTASDPAASTQSSQSGKRIFNSMAFVTYFPSLNHKIKSSHSSMQASFIPAFAYSRASS